MEARVKRRDLLWRRAHDLLETHEIAPKAACQFFIETLEEVPFLNHQDTLTLLGFVRMWMEKDK